MKKLNTYFFPCEEEQHLSNYLWFYGGLALSALTLAVMI